MITRLEIENFKAIRERIVVPLGPFTVLVGPNDAGKSTILQAMELLSKPGRGQAAFDRAILEYLPSHDPARTIHIKAQSDSGAIYEVAINPHSESIVLHSPELACKLVRLEPRRIAEPVPIDQPLDPDGYGLVNVVDRLLGGPDRDQIVIAEQLLRHLAPGIRTVTTKTVGNKKELHFLLADKAKTEVPAALISDGVLMATCFALLITGLGTRRLLIEEPENGIHPRMLGAIVETLRDAGAATGTQIVIATQSPILLNHVRPEEVLLVTRPDGGNVVVTPMTETKDFDERIKDFDLGELWYNVGERNLTAG